ncbi:MAG: agmatine deiminase family protein [Bacteroidales bacterium]
MNVDQNARIYLLIIFCWMALGSVLSQEDLKKPEQKLTHYMSPEEEKLKHLIGKDFISTPPPTGAVRNVAEFERMQGVLIRYPFGISYTVIAEMAEETNVVTIVSSLSQQNTVLSNYLSNGVNTDNCSFLIAPTESYWTRDYGPWYIFDGNDEPGIVDFPYNRPSRPNDDNIPVEMSDYLGINLFGMNVIHTGGNYMTDGYGKSSSSELVWEENPGLSHTQIDQMFLDYLNINTYHVVADPNNTYIDHIDCWGKFLDVDKVLIREVPSTHAQYDEIEATAAYYASQISAYGLPYQVFRVYTPNNQPYTNSLILNEKVLVPITGSSWDDDALLVYDEAMPGYEVVGLTGSWESTDALHCRAKGIADIGMLFIKHIPLAGNQPDLMDYSIQAEITAHSGQSIYADSVFLIYSVNSSPYDTVLMSFLGGKLYSGIIPQQTFGSEIAYYIAATDQSGRHETHPFIGLPDPNIFYVGVPALPDIAVNPSSFEVTLPPDESVVELMTLSNLGQLSLDYNITKQYISNKSKAYCTSSGGGSDEFIQNVSIGTINNSTGQSYYADYSGLSTFVDVGQVYPITITNGDPNWPTDQCGIWVDWNQNDDFSDDAPIAVSGSPGIGPYTASIVPPGDALGGLSRMRVQIIYNQSPDPCKVTFSYGEVEDYSLLVNNNFVDWLSLDPTAGNVSGEGNVNINLGFETAGLEEGDYFANVFIASNDPEQPEIIVPVHLIVSGARYVELKVFLEGPFNGTKMTTILNPSGSLPLSQPFNTSPWNYPGAENVPGIPNPDIVDWVLIEYRDAVDANSANNLTMVERQAAWLLKNGNIVGLDGASNPEVNVTIANNLFIVLHHRNHLSVLSAFPCNLVGAMYSYDFTTGMGQAYGTNAQVEMWPGYFGLISGDCNADGMINGDDKFLWIPQSGKSGYLMEDLNLDGEADNRDKNDCWVPNIGKGAQLP